MGILSGAASLGNWALDKLGLGWLTGVAPISPASSVYVTMHIPDLYVGGGVIHQANFTFWVPNHSSEFGKIAVNMAQNSLAKIELAIAIQSIVDPEGGLTIKDQLDPYHYQVIKEALEENGETVPPIENEQATVLHQLGGTITETGLLSGLGVAYDALQAAGQLGPLLEIPTFSTNPAGVNGHIPSPTFVGPTLPSGGITGLPTPPGLVNDVICFFGGSWPDYTKQLQIMNSAVVIDGLVSQYIVANIRNAIDTETGALLVKSAMGSFARDVSDQAINNTGGTPPEWEEPTGQPGLR